MDITDTLVRAQNPDESIRKPAEAWLQNAEETRLPDLLMHLSYELADERKMEGGRQLAGLYLKNTIAAKDPTTREWKRNRWLQLGPEVTSQIKNMVLTALQSQVRAAGHTAAQVVGTIGALELPIKRWDELLPALLKNVLQAPNDLVRIYTLEALGFICEDLSLDVAHQEVPPDWKKDTDQILTAIVDGIQAARPPEVRLAAAQALRNSLEFCKGNMDNEGERNVIMQVICEATQCENQEVKTTAFECIAQVADLYYDKLQPYILALFELTLACIRDQFTTDAAFQAIEFWNTLCDQETSILEEIEEYSQFEPSDDQQPRKCFFYVQNALPHLVPILMQLLTKQEEHQDEGDTWTISMAAGTCLALVAGTVKDQVLDHVIPFVAANINQQGWREKEAAIMAYGSILDGPSSERLRDCTQQAMPFFVQALQDPKPLVKDTTAWTIGKIFELHGQCVTPEMIQPLIQSLMVALDDAPQVANKACFALHNLATESVVRNYSMSPSSNYLSPFFTALVEKLVNVTDRPDASECSLRPAAYEAVNMLIQSSAPDCYQFLGAQVVPLVLQRLSLTFQMSDVAVAKEDIWTLQSLLCGVLTTCTHKLGKSISTYADQIMTLVLEVFRRHKHSSAHEEAFLLVGALADKMEKEFGKYMQQLHEVLLNALRNYEDAQVCQVAVGAVGDLCRALEKGMTPYVEPIIKIFLDNCRNQEVKMATKPHILSCFGDIAFQIGGAFDRFLPAVMTILGQAAETTARYDRDDEDMVEHINVLRESILDAYIGIVQGLSTDGKQELLLQPAFISPVQQAVYLNPVISLLQLIANDDQSNEAVIQRSIGLIGDLGSNLKGKVAQLRGAKWVMDLLNSAATLSETTVKTAQYTKAVLDRL